MLEVYNNPNKQSKDKVLHFLHGNSITPQSYSKLLNYFCETFLVKSFLLRPLWNTKKMPNFKNWTIFLDDYLEAIKDENNIVGIGHSIGGNLLLKAALIKPEKFRKIILFDPTFITPFKILIWNIICSLNLQSLVLPLIKSAKNKKMHYNSFDEIYSSYRDKKIFIERIPSYILSGSKLALKGDWSLLNHKLNKILIKPIKN